MNNLDMMGKRLNFLGGIRQEDRMIQGKLQTLQRVLAYSYQASTIQLVQSADSTLTADGGSRALDIKPIRALINPDKLKQDYDDKTISLEYGYLNPGDVFEWKKTDTYWISYLREITEDAYYRSAIRRCRYIIKFKDTNGEVHATWAAIRGPVETQIDYIQKNQISIDRPNLSLNILLPKNSKTVEAFDRYKEFLLDGRCWRVEAIDGISMEGILEVNAEEYYINREHDDLENEIVDGLLVEKIDPTPGSEIQGETFIKPRIPQTYTIDKEGGTWSVSKQYPVTILSFDDKSVELIWNKSTHGEFSLTWTNNDLVVEKQIVVESLF